jgi:hypothetical protein
MWEKAQNDEEFQKESPKVAPNPHSDQGYWNAVYEKMTSYDDAPDIAAPEMITEENQKDKITVPTPIKPNLTDKEMGDVVKSKANAANPVNPASVGKDQDYKPNMADVYQLEQLHDMKIKLYDLECKLNEKDALAKSKEGVKIQVQIEDIKKKIDELSDAITPNFLQSYLS